MKKKSDSITIPKKMIALLAPVAGIIVILIAKDKVGETFLFLIGIVYGIFLGIKFIKGQK